MTQERTKKSPIRRIIAVLLIIPVGYLAFKTRFPQPHYSIFDRVLIYIFPLLIVLAYLIDTWDKTESARRKVIKSVLLIMLALIYGVAKGQGNGLNENPVLGVMVVGFLLFSFSCFAFYYGSFQYRNDIRRDLTLKKAYFFSIVCFIYSVLQVPVWVLITGQFPPDRFTSFGAAFAAIGVLFALFGPAAPWLLMFRRHLVEQNRLRKNKS